MAARCSRDKERIITEEPEQRMGGPSRCNSRKASPARALALRAKNTTGVGAAFVKVNPPQPGKSGDDFSRQALSYLYHDTKSPKTGDETGRRAEKSKAGVCLEKLNVRDRLAKLSADDMDPAVRRAARDALGRLALVQKKKP